MNIHEFTNSIYLLLNLGIALIFSAGQQKHHKVYLLIENDPEISHLTWNYLIRFAITCDS